jgi:hypothetical protein
MSMSHADRETLYAQYMSHDHYATTTYLAETDDSELAELLAEAEAESTGAGSIGGRIADQLRAEQRLRHPVVPSRAPGGRVRSDNEMSGF